jgi:DNA-directed RNA polymerase specialized sigma24 family protein
MNMSTKTLSVTAASFEKVFAAIATDRPHMRPQGNALTGWRDIAWEALRRKKLGDTLRRAVEALSVTHREVLFVRDVKNLNPAETAWVLNITVGAVRYRLLRARMRVRDALASRLLPKTSEKNSDLANSNRHDISCKIRDLICQNSLSLA